MEEATIEDFLHVTVVSRYDRVLIKWNLNIEIEQPQKNLYRQLPEELLHD